MRRCIAALLLVLAVAGCTSSNGAVRPGPTFSPNPKLSELIAKADLAPCPASVTTPAAGGLPDVTLPCLGRGPTVHLAGLRGTPTVVNLWGSWCGPCQKETPFFAQAYNTLKKQVHFLGVDVEDLPDSALDFAAHVRPPMRYPSVVDADKKVLLGLKGPVAVPSTLFVDARGRVVHRVFAPYSSEAALRADIARYLGVSG